MANEPSDRKPARISPAGIPVFSYEAIEDFRPAAGDSSYEAIHAHVEAFLGPAPDVFHEIASEDVHVDILRVPPNEHCPHLRLVTSGMSDLAMPVPEDAGMAPHAELVITLPGDWRSDPASLEDEGWYWPYRLLKLLARFPHRYGTWVGPYQSVGNGNPPAPYAEGLPFCAAMLLALLNVPDEFHVLRVNDAKDIRFLAVVPLTARELAYRLKKGSGALLDRFDEFGVTDVVDVARPDVAPRGLRALF